MSEASASGFHPFVNKEWFSPPKKVLYFDRFYKDHTAAVFEHTPWVDSVQHTCFGGTGLCSVMCGSLRHSSMTQETIPHSVLFKCCLPWRSNGTSHLHCLFRTVIHPHRQLISVCPCFCVWAHTCACVRGGLRSLLKLTLGYHFS